MKNSKLFIVAFFFFFAHNGYSQSIGEWKTILDSYCEQYFKNCFGWDYIEIVSIDDIDYVSSSNVKIKGKVRNTGYFGREYTREFRADLVVYSNKITINFKKYCQTNVEGAYWQNCENTIYK